jgi:hypothetical protein
LNIKETRRSCLCIIGSLDQFILKYGLPTLNLYFTIKKIEPNVKESNIYSPSMFVNLRKEACIMGENNNTPKMNS